MRSVSFHPFLKGKYVLKWMKLHWPTGGGAGFLSCFQVFWLDSFWIVALGRDYLTVFQVELFRNVHGLV